MLDYLIFFNILFIGIVVNFVFDMDVDFILCELNMFVLILEMFIIILIYCDIVFFVIVL